MKIQLKRSNVLDGGQAKEPTAAQMEYGELAVNYSDTDPAIFLKDAADNIIRISGVGNISDDGQVEVPSTVNPPTNPTDGNLWYNADDGRLYVYYNDGNSSQWVDASPDGWNEQEALGGYVEKAGDNMTGDLTLGTDKITLDASNGNITGDSFKSIVRGTDSGLYLYKDGGTNANAINISPTNSGGDITTSLGYDGSGTFAGTVAVAGGVATAGNGIDVASDGVVRIRRDIDAEALSIYKNGNSTNERVTVLSTDGNAAFDGTISAGSATFASGEMQIRANGRTDIGLDGTPIVGPALYSVCNVDEPYLAAGNFRNTGNGPAIICRTADGSNGLIVKNDGSAEFAGTATAGGNPDAGNNVGASLNHQGVLQVTRTGTNQLFQGFTQGNSTPTSTITADGTITAKGYSMASLPQI